MAEPFPRRVAEGRRTLGLGGAACLLASALATASCCAFSTCRYNGPESGHFDGGRFFNPDWVDARSRVEALRYLVHRSSPRWPYRNPPVGPRPPTSVEPGQMRATFVNHSTVLLQMDRINLLTDPVWSDRVGPLNAVGPQRKRPPGIRFADLPPIDAVLISHNHYDHLDLPTLRRLKDAHRPVFFVGLGNRQLLEDNGIDRVTEVDWWSSVVLRSSRDPSAVVEIVGVPARHDSGRGMCDVGGSLWLGFVARGTAGSLYFAGDTGWGSHFRRIGERLGPIRLAVLPIGAYLPRWFMHPVHIGPNQAVRAHQALGAQTSLAMHFGTFQQGNDGEFTPLQDLSAALLKAGLSPERFWVLEHGEGRYVGASLDPLPEEQMR